MQQAETVTFCATSRQDWRQWLQDNHSSSQSVWLVYHKKNTNKPSITWIEAVEEALCFGWIDSVKKSLGDDAFMQFFCKRKPTSTWSKINKEKVKRLADDGLMAPAGYASIETAQQNGSWIVLDEVEALIIPKDLEKEFKNKPGSKDFFLSLSKSAKKAMLQWLVLAKQETTRQKRIREIAELASQQLKPKQFR